VGALTKAGYKYEEAEIVMIPENMVEVENEEMAEKVMKLFEALEDNEDVNDVYANFDISDELMDKIMG
ncbi:MAG: YebC/PmpR family DNA-binding transcriptional regulator, partial [Psychrilyobacter sp.]|uniref:YebC/PmpR family DNA-binding transcriptional regulator n=1 Tax=Psychrilyobacter sp. TaxID=2586924 RepID=UPI003C767175